MCEIKGINIEDVIKEYGSPLYLYNAESIRGQYNKLADEFSKFKYRIHYAMKANENPAILNIIKDLGGGIDAVSPNEVDRALNMGFRPNDIVFTPSCTSANELVYGLEVGVNVHIGAVEYFSLLGYKLKGKSIGLRLNPSIDIKGNQKIATAHSNSKFGIPLRDLNKVKMYQDKYGFKVKGLHIHTGSNVKDVDDLNKSIDVLFDKFELFNGVEYIDIGSGLKIKYKESDSVIDLKGYASYIKSKLDSLDRDIEIKIEPGKYLVGNAGCLLTTVNIVKHGYEKIFAGVDSGFHHLIRPMYYDAYHEIKNISNPKGEIEMYDVVGQLCEEDTFARNRQLNKIRIGDVLMIKSAGAYGASMIMEYNLRKKPKEVLIDNESFMLI